MDVQLFLARPGTGDPAFPEGIALEDALLAASAPPAEPPAARVERDRILADDGADPGELDRQRWGLVVPRGEPGKALLHAARALRRKRAEDQRADVEVYEVDPGMTAARTDDWIRNEYLEQVGRSLDRLPRHLLILGGPDQVSWAMQQQLAAAAMVGRLSFQDAERRADIEGYEAYVHKVLRWEGDRALRVPQVLFYGAEDGGRAAESGRAHILRPNLDLLLRTAGRTRPQTFGTDDPAASTAEDVQARCARMLEAARGEATVLFSVSHGVGGDTWASPAEQRATQGALAVTGKPLTAADVATGRFLPGGAWFFFACFSAGTPAESLFRPWVARLHQMGCFSKTPEEVVLSAPVDGVPFVAALPQAALRNEDGPLAVVGHVDLALTFSFLRKDYSPAHKDKPYPERFSSLLKSLVLGRRMGVAFDGIARGFRELDSALASRHAAAGEAPPAGEAPAAGPEAPPAAVAREERASLASLWLERQDLRSFVLLGDPAVRLPLGVAASPWAGQQSPQTMEQAVMEHLRGGSIADVAARAGVPERDLQRWVDTFLKGARDALSKLRR